MTPPFLVFDFPQPLCFTEPVEVIIAETVAEVIPALLRVQAASEAGLYAAGFVAYEAAPAFDSAFSVHPPLPGMPLLWFGLFVSSRDMPKAKQALCGPVEDLLPDMGIREYQEAIASIHQGIEAGDFYQVNHTFRLGAPWHEDGLGLFQRLTEISGAKYSAFLNLGRHQIISASPELFFHRQGSLLSTRPMKGTRPRGRWCDEDEALAAELAYAEKDRAENLMIVDLLRNDLGRIAVNGSVKVPKLFEIEQYPTLWQMTSTVEAKIPAAVGLVDIFTALFPCGSVTGAPKVSAMKRIAALETSPRGPYCGAIGTVSPSGEAIFNVAIRTAVIDTETGRLQYGVGGGIVWDSTAEREYEEALSKAAILAAETPKFELLETLCWENGEYLLRERHIARLLLSAEYFRVPVLRSAVEVALDDAAASFGAAKMRVRLLVAPEGLPRIESRLLLPLPELPLSVVLASTPVNKNDPFLCHKTTHRAVYEAHKQAHPEAFDVLLWNEEGELTEFTIGNLVLRNDEGLWTPPRACGLLGGVLRDALLSEGKLCERILRREDLITATGIWLINSVRGFVPVQIDIQTGEALLEGSHTIGVPLAASPQQ